MRTCNLYLPIEMHYNPLTLFRVIDQCKNSNIRLRNSAQIHKIHRYDSCRSRFIFETFTRSVDGKEKNYRQAFVISLKRLMMSFQRLKTVLRYVEFFFFLLLLLFPSVVCAVDFNGITPPDVLLRI